MDNLLTAEVVRGTLAVAEGLAWAALGNDGRALEMLEQGEAALSVRAESLELARLRLAKAEALRRLQRLPEAVACLVGAIPIYRRYADRTGLSGSARALAEISWARGGRPEGHPARSSRPPVERPRR